MHKYMKADLRRIARRLPRRILLLLIVISVGFLSYPYKSDVAVTGINVVDNLSVYTRFFPLVIGIIEILYVFGDDFKGKTAQIAIGIGVSRKKVILAKWLEMIILYAIDIAILFAVNLGINALKGIMVPGPMIRNVVILFIVSVIEIAASMALVMPILFASQGTTLCIIVYIIFKSGGLAELISLLASTEWLQPLHLNNYVLTNCLNVFRTRLILGNFKMTSLLGILLYILIGLGITYAVYHKRELEF